MPEVCHQNKEDRDRPDGELSDKHGAIERTVGCAFMRTIQRVGMVVRFEWGRCA